MSEISADELINLAMEDLIDVEGKADVDLSHNQLLCGNFKISPLKPSKIPLFMAIHLQKRNKVRILVPEEYKNVERYVEREEENEFFTELPEHFFEIAKILKINMHEIEKLRQLRLKKFWNSLKNLEKGILFMTNFTRWEFRQVKKYLVDVLKETKKLEKMKEN